MLYYLGNSIVVDVLMDIVSGLCMTSCALAKNGVSVVNPDGICGGPLMVSGLSGFGVSKQNKKFLIFFLIPNIIL
jgi:hypothetical protein